MLAGGDDTVMATETGSDDLTVINHHNRYPGIGRMTVLTQIRSQNMACRFTGCDRIVVTGYTGTQYLGMINR